MEYHDTRNIIIKTIGIMITAFFSVVLVYMVPHNILGYVAITYLSIFSLLWLLDR